MATLGKKVILGAVSLAAALLFSCSSRSVNPDTSGISHVNESTRGRGIAKVDDFAVLDAGENQGAQKVQLKKGRRTALAMLDPKNVPNTLHQGHNAKFRRSILIWPNDHQDIGETTLLVSSAVLKNYKVSVTPGLLTPVGIAFSDKEIRSRDDMRTATEVGIVDLAVQILPKLKIIAVDEHMNALGAVDLGKATNPGDANKLLHENIDNVSIPGSPNPPTPDAARRAVT